MPRSSIATSATLVGVGLALAAAVAIDRPSHAADHIDSPAAVGDPSVDITDLYSWMSTDGEKLNLVLNTFGTAFSDSAQYVFHVASMPTFGGAETDYQIICTFSGTPETAECWAGDDDYAIGDASATTGLASRGGQFRVFAGQRNDPFYFNLTGFQSVVTLVKTAAPGLAFDGTGCPQVDANTSAALVGLLATTSGTTAVDFFAGLETHSLVIEIDRDLVSSGGDILGVWAATYRAN